LGQVFLTVGAGGAFEESNQSANEFLAKDSTANWGDVCEDDRKENELSAKEGFRILSAYKTDRLRKRRFNYFGSLEKFNNGFASE
jgi:hypothetical protein